MTETCRPILGYENARNGITIRTVDIINFKSGANQIKHKIWIVLNKLQEEDIGNNIARKMVVLSITTQSAQDATQQSHTTRSDGTTVVPASSLQTTEIT